MEKIIDICPLESDLMVTETNYSCSENDCTSSFNKISNLQLHLVKHHKVGSLVPKSKGVVFRFFCPKKDCVYNIDRANNKSFSQKRLLKQHYMKMHASKDYVCNKCGLQNSLASAHARHSKSCGMKFSCGACGWEYNSNESLLVHLMRKHPQIHQAYLKNKAECKKKSSEVSKKKFDKVTDIKKNKIPNNCQLNEKSYDFTKTDLPKIPIDNKNKCFNVRDVIQFDHNYTKSFNVEGNFNIVYFLIRILCFNQKKFNCRKQ